MPFVIMNVAIKGSPRAIDQETGLASIRLRQELPKATVVRLIHEMNVRELYHSWLASEQINRISSLNSNGTKRTGLPPKTGAGSKLSLRMIFGNPIVCTGR